MKVELRQVALILIVVAAACAAGRLFSAQRLNEPSLTRDGDPAVDLRPNWPATRPRPMPTFSSNDRARWATVRSLVDNGTYVVGVREEVDGTPPYKDTGIIFEDGWQSIDRVLHPETKEFLSSKPPLLSTLVAGLYWLLHALFGWTLNDHPFAVVRTILVLINILPFAVYLWILDRWVGRFSNNAWTRLVILSAAAFGTTVTPFLITFNNHTLGTFSVLFALDAALAIWVDGRTSPIRYFQAGLFAAFAVTNELPALSFAVGVLGVLMFFDPKRTLAFAIPPVLLMVAAFLWTNYLAVGQWRPAYSEFGSSWYEYPGSHWRKPPPGEIKYGIDWASMHESRTTYALHLLIGHHGLFSLTPLWLLSVAGMFVFSKPAHLEKTAVAADLSTEQLPRWLAPLTLGLTVVVIGFFLIRTDNYGGWTNGLRWLMWLSPLWLLTMIPIVDRLATCRWGRGLTVFLLAVSVISASYSPWNPWRHPWMYDLLLACGWPGYGR